MYLLQHFNNNPIEYMKMCIYQYINEKGCERKNSSFIYNFRYINENYIALNLWGSTHAELVVDPAVRGTYYSRVNKFVVFIGIFITRRKILYCTTQWHL